MHEALRMKHAQGLDRLWWPHQDSNLEPVDYESIALTVAPWGREKTRVRIIPYSSR